MSTHVTIHTGFMGDQDVVEIDWFDHNNERHVERLEILIEPWDKPRTLTLRLNGRVIFSHDNRGEVYR